MPECPGARREIDSSAEKLLDWFAGADAARDIVGRRLQLSVSVGAESSSEPEQPAQKPKANPKRLAEENPKLRALTDKFHGEIIEVVKPEQ